MNNECFTPTTHQFKYKRTAFTAINGINCPVVNSFSRASLLSYKRRAKDLLVNRKMNSSPNSNSPNYHKLSHEDNEERRRRNAARRRRRYNPLQRSSNNPSYPVQVQRNEYPNIHLQTHNNHPHPPFIPRNEHQHHHQKPQNATNPTNLIKDEEVQSNPNQKHDNHVGNGSATQQGSSIDQTAPPPPQTTSTSTKPLISITEELAKMSSTTEVKHALRKIEFPQCAKEALIKIEQLLIGRSVSIKHMDLAIDLMAEFIFSEIDRRGNRKTTSLTSLQELQLLQVFCEYFSGPATEQVKNTVFLSLFPAGNTLTLRIKVLCKLVSMAVCVPSPSVLHAAGIWMQQLGNTSAHSLQLAKSLVNDYFIFTPSAVARLTTLPNIAPQFTANFLTAVAEIYLTDKQHCFTPPPLSLLETITEWVSDNYQLCTAAQNQQSALPSGAIQMAAITPFAGLLKWCILFPVYAFTSQYDGSLSIKNLKNKNKFKECDSLYTKLHFAVTKSLIETGRGTGPPTALCAQHLVSVVPSLQLYIGKLLQIGCILKENVALNTSLDRLAQATQVGLATRCMYGNIQDLFNQLQLLPSNRLLKVVITQHKEIVI